MKQGQLFIVGTPLDETSPLPPSALEWINKAHLIIGESAKLTRRHCRVGKTPGAKTETPIHLLDHATEDDLKRLTNDLKQIQTLHGSNAIAILLSDTGMPILFDPGRDVLEQSIKLGFRIRAIPTATSWGTAAALSGFLPPFHIADFLPRESNERASVLRQLGQLTSHCVIMDTPYRFRPLLDELRRNLGDERQAFLAWDIARESEFYFWGSLAKISDEIHQRGLVKGEFVLIIKSSEREKKR